MRADTTFISMKISEIKAGQSFDVITAQIVELSDVREFSKFGKSGKVLNAKVKDDSGECSLTLWNDQIDQVSSGDTVTIKNGFAKEWKGDLQISVGKFGSFEVGGGSAVAEDSGDSEEPADSGGSEDSSEVSVDEEEV